MKCYNIQPVNAHVYILQITLLKKNVMSLNKKIRKRDEIILIQASSKLSSFIKCTETD